jgi:hypothetical protein
MSDGEFHTYAGLLAASALVLTVLGVRGFGQSASARVLDGLFALGFLGYAGYLFQTRPEQVAGIVSYVFLVPVVAVLVMWRARRRARARRLAAGVTPPPYAERKPATGPTPFPAPPPPLDSSAGRDEHAASGNRPRPPDPPADGVPERPVSPGPGVTRPPIPSGLAGHHHIEQSTLPGAYQPKPSGLAGHHLPAEADEHTPTRPAMPSGLPHPPPTGSDRSGATSPYPAPPGDRFRSAPDEPARSMPSRSMPDESFRSARHAAAPGAAVPPGLEPVHVQPEPETVRFDQATYVGTHSGEQPMYRKPGDRPSVDRPGTAFPPPAHAEPRPPADPRYSDYGRSGHYGYTEPEPAGDDRYPQTTQFDYNSAQETSSRLRQPAYLAKYSPTEPQDQGRHRADDTTEPPSGWPPREWPPPRG